MKCTQLMPNVFLTSLESMILYRSSCNSYLYFWKCAHRNVQRCVGWPEAHSFAFGTGECNLATARIYENSQTTQLGHQPEREVRS